MIWVFKTTVQDQEKVSEISDSLDGHILPHGRWTFDLEDCDKILRIEHENLEIDQVISSLSEAGVNCEELF